MTADDIPNNADRDLLAAVARADMAAFERLYRQYEKRVYQYICSFVRDRSAAEEATVDTLTAVWHGAAGFTGQSKVSSWILGIARHKALDVVRRVDRQAGNVALDAAAAVVDSGTGPAEALSSNQSGHLIRRALAALSTDHQEILQLVFYQELPYEEISTLLAIPTNTVKTRVYYAKQQLKQRLDLLAAQGAV